MCGIVGYIGHREACPILIKGLKRREYRGYDSAGMAWINKNKETKRTGGWRGARCFFMCRCFQKLHAVEHKDLALGCRTSKIVW